MQRCTLLQTRRVAASFSVKHPDSIRAFLCAARWYGCSLHGSKLCHPFARSGETKCCHSLHNRTHFTPLLCCSSSPGASSQLCSQSRPTESEEVNSGKVKKFTVDAHLTCSGCGSVLQAESSTKAGFVPLSKLQELKLQAEEECEHKVKEVDSTSKEDYPEENHKKPPSTVVVDSTSKEELLEEDNKKKPPNPVICKRCFSLKHYNSALNITLQADDYLRHLAHLRDKRALIILMLDISDFPGSLFPHLSTLLSPNHQVMLVANKIDLLPPSLLHGFHGLERMIAKECLESSLVGCKIAKVHFISAKTGDGIEKLANSVINSWGNRGDVYLLGCTNVGKSSLFNRLLVSLCGAIPGRLNVDGNVTAPTATISRWPGTTLGLLSFPIISGGKRRRLLAQAQREALLEVTKGGHRPPNHEGLNQKHIRGLAFREDDIVQTQVRKLAKGAADLDAEDAIAEVGLSKRPVVLTDSKPSTPINRCWLHDTPGAINDAQVQL